MDWQAITFGAVVGGASMGVGVVRQRRRFRRDLAELYPRWKALTASRRREIRRAVRGGRAARDPRDAVFVTALASRLIDNFEGHRRSWFYRGHLVLHLGVAVVSLGAVATILATRGWNTWALLQVLVLLYVFSTFGLFRFLSDRAVRRARRAKDENTPLVRQYEPRDA